MSRPLSIFIVHPSRLLTDHRPHGDGLAAHSFISGLAERGHRLHVAAEEVDLERDLGERVTLHRLGDRWTAPGTRRPSYALRVRSLFARLQPQVAFDVSHQLNPVDVGLSLFLPRSSVPLVLGPYWPLWPPAAIGLRDSLAQRLAGPPVEVARKGVAAMQQRRATLLLVSTAAARERLHGVSEGQTRELPYGIDLERFALRAAPDSAAWDPGGEGPILFLAGLEPWKGVETLLDAFELVAGDLGDRRLVIAGEGSLADLVRARVATSSVGDRVDVLGRVSREEVPRLLSRCSVYCLPSVREPFGISALEAMACGRPVIATAAGGLQHLVDDAGGQLFPPGDAPALAKLLRELLAAPDRRRAMGAHNARVVADRYSMPRVLERLEAVYQEAMALRAGGPSRPPARSVGATDAGNGKPPVA